MVIFLKVKYQYEYIFIYTNKTRFELIIYDEVQYQKSWCINKYISIIYAKNNMKFYRKFSEY